MKKFLAIVSVSLFLTAVCAPVISVSAQEPHKKESVKTEKKDAKPANSTQKAEKKASTAPAKTDKPAAKTETAAPKKTDKK